MKSIKIGLLIEERGYKEDLLKGLARRYQNGILSDMSRENCGDAEEKDIIIADKYNADKIEDKNILKKIILTDSYCRVSQLIRDMERKYFQNQGYIFLREREGEFSVIGMCSNQGGSGCTAISLSLGRMLTLKEDVPILYINLRGWQNFKKYEKNAQGNKRSTKELMYRQSQNMPVHLSDYVFKGKFGLFYMDAGGICTKGEMQQLEKILELIKNEEFFNKVIIDMGNIDGEYLYHCFERIICINNRNDLRSNIATGNFIGEIGQGLINVYNRSNLTVDGADSVEIEEDKDSFVIEDDKINVSLEKRFAKGIELLVEKCR